MARKQKSGWRLLWPRLLLVTASFALVLIVLEAVARITGQAAVPRRPESGGGAELPVLTQDDVGRPNQRGIFKGAHYRSNRTGLRGPNYPMHPRPDVFRIAIVGDSVVFGSGVGDDATYAAGLEERLKRDRGGAFEVVNAGQPGLNAKWIMRRLERLQASYRFHLAVYGWTLNDIEGKAYRRLRSQRDRLERFGETRRFEDSRSELLRQLWPRWIDLYRRVSGATEYHDEAHKNYFENRPAWHAFAKSLDEFAELTQGRGICGHVFLHTHSFDLDEDHPVLDVYQRVEEAARRRGLSVTQSFPHWQGRRAESLWVSRMDSHPNDEGHRILADALFQGLERDLPADCWEKGPTQGRVPSAARPRTGNRERAA